MTEDELQAIEAMMNAATPGPWEARTFGPCNCGQCPAHVNVFAGPHQWPKINPPDAEFIASARTDVPKLITEVRRLKALCAKAYERVRFLDDMGVGGEGWQSPELSDIVASLGAIARDEDE